MKHDLKTYIILFLVFILAVAASAVMPASDVTKAVVASPGVVALLAALFQLMRDQAAFEKELEIQSRQLQFTLGAASHMAEVAFDKHAEFCEKYMDCIHEMMRTLYRHGNTPKALDHAAKFHVLREDYATWLTNEIDEKLEVFEQAIRKLGAEAEFIKNTSGLEEYAEQRSMMINSSYKLFREVLGIEADENTPINEEHAIKAIKGSLRNILDTEELTSLRKYLIKEACNVLREST